MNDKIRMIKITDISPNPLNPRTSLGDLGELTESIKKNGIMQNLTIVPTGKKGKYMALIGHRRLQAAADAGLEEVPAIVAKDLSEREQLAIMLEENMQRNDLTIIEQAQGFQLMLDLGETEESIAQKTGFSRTTVRRRLEIAKLDPELVESAVEDYQITLTDLEELNKIEDPEKRNEILRGAKSKYQIINGVNSALEQEKKEAALEKLIPALEVRGVQKAKQSETFRRWDSDYKEVASFDLLDMPEEINFSEVKDKKLLWSGGGQYEQIVRVYYIEKTKRQVDPEEAKKQADLMRRSQEIEDICEDIIKKEKQFILRMIEDKEFGISKEDELKAWEDLWPSLLAELQGYSCRRYDIIFFFDDIEEEYDLPALKAIYEAVIIAWMRQDKADLRDWNCRYQQNTALDWVGLISVLKRSGFEILDEEEDQILSGTHEAYTKDGQED